MAKNKSQKKPNMKKSLKHAEIDKNQAIIFGIVAIASFVIVFSLFTAHALITQQRYQTRVIAEKEQSLEDLERSLSNAQELQRTYSAFVDTPENIIGGFSEGDGEQDGSNARIILDALPSQYDFPAFITSVEQILLQQDVTIDAIGGEDEELEFRDAQSDDPIQIPIRIGMTGDYDAIQEAVDAFEASIRPFKFFRFDLAGDDDNLRVNLSGHSYFQPQTQFELRSRTINP